MGWLYRTGLVARDYDSEYGHAVFVAMRQLEVEVRRAAALTDSDIGAPLMRRAFGPGGPLCAEHRNAGENKGLADLLPVPWATSRIRPAA